MLKRKLPQTTILAYSALLVATAIWGFATVAIKFTLDYIPLMSFLFYRFLLVCLVLLPFVWLELKKNPINTKDLPTLILLGLLGQSGILIIFAGIKYTTAIDSGIIGAIAPLMIIGLGHYYYREKINKFLEVGLLIATFGTLLVVLEPALSHNTVTDSISSRIFGNILNIIYNLVFALYIILSKKVMGERSGNVSKTLQKLNIKPLKNRYSPFMQTALSFYVALATFIPLYILEAYGVFGAYSFNITQLPTQGLLGLLYMAIFSSIVAYMVFSWGLDNAKVADSGIFTYLGPAFTLPVAYLVLGELPSSAAIAGSMIIAIGVVIAETKKS